MYQFDENYVKISEYDIYLALDYIAKNNIKDEKINDQITQCTSELFDNAYTKLEKDNPIIDYILEAYKSELSLKMIKNSILWSIIDIKNEKKHELEFLYKTVMLEKLKSTTWDDKLENKLILKLLKDNINLYKYIAYTQYISDYLEDKVCKVKTQQKLKKHLEK